MGTVYSTVAKLSLYALPLGAVNETNTTVAEAALQRSSDKASSQLAKRYTLPLASWGEDLAGAVAEMAAWDMLVLQAFDAADQGNVYKYRAEKAWEWIVDVANGDGELVDVVDDTPEVDGSGPSIVTSLRRGW